MNNLSRVIGLISISLAVGFVMHFVRLHVLGHQPNVPFSQTSSVRVLSRSIRSTQSLNRSLQIHSMRPPSGSNLMTTSGLVETDSDLSTAHDLAKQIQLTPPRQR